MLTHQRGSRVSIGVRVTPRRPFNEERPSFQNLKSPQQQVPRKDEDRCGNLDRPAPDMHAMPRFDDGNIVMQELFRRLTEQT